MLVNIETATEKVPEASTQILRHTNVSKRLGISASKLFDMVAKGVFPKPFQIIPGGRAVGYLESDVDKWIHDRKATATKEQL
jgi:prophage regulatory protein